MKGNMKEEETRMERKDFKIKRRTIYPLKIYSYLLS